MPIIPERLDDLYAAAERGESRVIALPVTDDIDLIVHPPGEHTDGLVRIVDADGSVAVWPSEIKDLVYYLIEAAVQLATWQAQRSSE